MFRTQMLVAAAAALLPKTAAFQGFRNLRPSGLVPLSSEQTVTDLDLDDMQAMFEKADKTVKIVDGPSESYASLPGVAAPFGFFDPAGFAADADADQFKLYREAGGTLSYFLIYLLIFPDRNKAWTCGYACFCRDLSWRVI